MFLVPSLEVHLLNMLLGGGVKATSRQLLNGTLLKYFIGFYINLPAGAATALLLVLFFHPGERETSKLLFTQKLEYLDLLGFLIFIPAAIMLLLAVQWG